MPTHRRLHALLSVPLLLVLVACGSDGDGANSSTTTPPPPPPPPVQPVEISAIVAGTTVLVVDEHGAIIAIDDTDGREPDRDTDGDGIADGYSITLTDLPLNVPIRVFVISAGSIAPLTFETGSESASLANVFRFASRGRLELGLVTIEDADGPVAVAQFNPADDELITGAARVDVLPLGINEPPTSGLSLAELNQRSLTALRDGWLGGARTYSAAAVALAGNSVSNDADLARVTAALARVGAALTDTPSDDDFAQLERLGDLLDAFGVADDRRRGSIQAIAVPDALPVDSPSGNPVRDFAYDVLGAELLAATQLLDATSTSFEFDLSEAGGAAIEIDHGEVLVARALFSATLASISTLAAHDLDADVDEAVANNRPSRRCSQRTRSFSCCRNRHGWKLLETLGWPLWTHSTPRSSG
jgi:hypothetical protein